MIVVKKIFGLVFSLALFFSLVNVQKVRADFFECKCAWQVNGCNPAFPQDCVAPKDTACPSTYDQIGNDGCDLNTQDGDGGSACYTKGHPEACGGGNPTPTTVPPTPTPIVNARVQGRYRLQPGNISIGETHFGSDANRLHVYLDHRIQDMMFHDEITSGGIGDTSTSYTSDGLVGWKLLDFMASDWQVNVNTPSTYSVGYTLCYNNTNCHVVPTGQPVPNKGTRVALNEQTLLDTRPAGSTTAYADVYWHFCKNYAPNNLRVSPEFPCNQAGAQTVMWDETPGAVTYSLRIDNGGAWTGDLNGDGVCDFQGLGGDGDYCKDGIPATISPSYVIPYPGLPSGKSYRIWVHAINQCGGGTAVSTQVIYDRICPSPTVPAPSATGTTVSCQNITVWKNGVQLIEPLTGKINLGDRIDYKSSVSSSRSLSKIYFLVTKGTNRSQRMGISAFCPAGGTTRNYYTATLNLLQDVYGSYNVKYDGVEYGTCLPLVTLVP